mgnify:CR=1 FL=1
MTSAAASGSADCAAVQAAEAQIQSVSFAAGTAISKDNLAATQQDLAKLSPAAEELVAALGSDAPASAQQWVAQTQQIASILVQAQAADDPQELIAQANQLNSPEYKELSDQITSAADMACPSGSPTN